MSDRSSDVVDRLIAWLESSTGGSVTTTAPVTSNDGGFDSDIYFVSLSGDALPSGWDADLVVRVKPMADQLEVAKREHEIHGWLASRGYPTPAMLRVFEPGELLDVPVQVMVRAPGTTMLSAIQRRPWRARAMIRSLAAHHVALHQLDPAGFPGSDADLLDRRMGLSLRTADELGDDELRRAIEVVEDLTADLRSAPEVVCHGDYHPLNVIVDDDELAVIDWTDAGTGDLHGDVARTLLLFDLAAIAASNALERVVLRAVGPRLGAWYRRDYEAAHHLDGTRVLLWRPVHLLHGLSQVRGLHAGLFEADGEPTEDQSPRVPPSLDGELARRFWVAVEDAR